MGKDSPKPAAQQTVTQNVNSAPWSVQQPYLKQLFNSADNYFKNEMFLPDYMSQNYAPTTEAQNAGLDALIKTAQGGSPLIDAAQGLIQGTAAGNYLDKGNPYFGAAFQNISDAIRPTVDAAFEANGRYGSGAADYAKASALTNAGANLGYGNYNMERGNQMTAALASPQMASASFLFPQALYNAGALEQGNAQAAIDAQNRLEQYNADRPYIATQRYGSLISGNYGSQGDTTQNSPLYGPSTGQQVLGGLIGGAGLYNMVGGLDGLAGILGPNSLLGTGAYSSMLGGGLGTSLALGADPFAQMLGAGLIAL